MRNNEETEVGKTNKHGEIEIGKGQTQSTQTENVEKNDEKNILYFPANWKYIFAFSYIALIILQSVQNIVLAFMGRGGGIESNDLFPSSMQGEVMRVLQSIYTVVNDTSMFIHKR